MISKYKTSLGRKAQPQREDILCWQGHVLAACVTDPGVAKWNTFTSLKLLVSIKPDWKRIGWLFCGSLDIKLAADMDLLH